MNQTMQCPKCRGVMRTYNRNGVHIEQCDQCRGIFLDYGELEAISRLESQWAQPAAAPPPAAMPPGAMPPAAPQPGWGAPPQGHYGHGHHGHYKRKKGFASMLFSS